METGRKIYGEMPDFTHVMRITMPLLFFSVLFSTACRTTKPVAKSDKTSKSTVPAYIIRDPALLEQRADSLFFAAERSKLLGDYRTAITQFSDYLRLKKNN